jgi:hypothetical protein
VVAAVGNHVKAWKLIFVRHRVDEVCFLLFVVISHLGVLGRTCGRKLEDANESHDVI